MRLWMSRSIITHQYAFWLEQPDVIWGTNPDGARIGYDSQDLCQMINVHKLFPNLEIPSGEMVEVEVIELENGYYIGFVE